MRSCSEDDRRKVAYLGALTLLFSYAEMFFPRVVPFFRLGLANIAILMAFDLSFFRFLQLLFIKTLAAGMMAGTLFSPFFLVSIGQSFTSGVLMYGLFKMNRLCKGRLFSLYGISMAGSAASGVVQLFLCSLYLGEGTYTLLGPVLLFNLASGIVTAFFGLRIGTGDGWQSFFTENDDGIEHGVSSAKRQVILLAGLFVFAAAVFFVDVLWILVLMLIVSVLCQLKSGRRFMVMPHVSLWLFVIVTSLFVPQGMVLLDVWGFSITQGALTSGVEKALKLSAVSCLSQCAAGMRLPETTVTGMSLACFRKMSDTFRTGSGSLLERMKAAIKG